MANSHFLVAASQLFCVVYQLRNAWKCICALIRLLASVTFPSFHLNNSSSDNVKFRPLNETHKNLRPFRKSRVSVKCSEIISGEGSLCSCWDCPAPGLTSAEAPSCRDSFFLPLLLLPASPVVVSLLLSFFLGSVLQMHLRNDSPITPYLPKYAFTMLNVSISSHSYDPLCLRSERRPVYAV